MLAAKVTVAIWQAWEPIQAGAKGDTTNPLDGVTPSFTIFGAKFTEIWQKVAGGLWGLGILVAIFYLGRGILAYAQSQGTHPQQMRDAKREAVQGAWALGGLLALAAIVSAMITIFGQ